MSIELQSIRSSNQLVASWNKCMKHYRLLTVMALGLLIAACGGGGESPSTTPAVNYTYSIPAQTNDGWATGHLEDHGFDLQLISEMIDAINSGQVRGIDSISIVRNNTLLMHAAYPRSLDKFDNWVGNGRVQSRGRRSRLHGIPAVVTQSRSAQNSAHISAVYNVLRYMTHDVMLPR